MKEEEEEANKEDKRRLRRRAEAVEGVVVKVVPREEKNDMILDMRDVSFRALLLLLRIFFASIIQRERLICVERKSVSKRSRFFSVRTAPYIITTPLKKRSKHEALRSKNEALKKLNLSTNDVLKP